MSALERRVRSLIKHRPGFDIQFGIDYFITLSEFKAEHPVRTGLKLDYTALWVVDYLVKNYHYQKKPVNGETHNP